MYEFLANADIKSPAVFLSKFKYNYSIMRPNYRYITRKIKRQMDPANRMTTLEKTDLMQTIFNCQLGLIKTMGNISGYEHVLASNVWDLYSSMKYVDTVNGVDWQPKLDIDTKNMLKSFNYIA